MAELQPREITYPVQTGTTKILLQRSHTSNILCTGASSLLKTKHYLNII